MARQSAGSTGFSTEPSPTPHPVLCQLASPRALTFMEMPATMPRVTLLPSDATCWKKTTERPAHLPAQERQQDGRGVAWHGLRDACAAQGVCRLLQLLPVAAASPAAHPSANKREALGYPPLLTGDGGCKVAVPHVPHAIVLVQRGQQHRGVPGDCRWGRREGGQASKPIRPDAEHWLQARMVSAAGQQRLTTLRIMHTCTRGRKG